MQYLIPVGALILVIGLVDYLTKGQKKATKETPTQATTTTEAATEEKPKPAVDIDSVDE